MTGNGPEGFENQQTDFPSETATNYIVMPENEEMKDNKNRQANSTISTYAKQPKERISEEIIIIVDFIYKIVGILGFAGVIISCITLITTIYPQAIPDNQDYVRMANAGDAYSQVFLGEHFLEIGEYSDAIYWYKLATINASEYQAMACNNLGVLYAEGFGLSDYNNEGMYRFQTALLLFAKAYSLTSDLLESEKYKQNGIEILRFYWDDCYSVIEKLSGDSKMWADEAESLRNKIYQFSQSFFIYRGPTFHEGNIYYTYSGSVLEIGDKSLLQTVYKYNATVFEENTDPIDLHLERLQIN